MLRSRLAFRRQAGLLQPVHPGGKGSGPCTLPPRRTPGARRGASKRQAGPPVCPGRCAFSPCDLAAAPLQAPPDYLLPSHCLPSSRQTGSNAGNRKLCLSSRFAVSARSVRPACRATRPASSSWPASACPCCCWAAAVTRCATCRAAGATRRDACWDWTCPTSELAGRRCWALHQERQGGGQGTTRLPERV